MSTRDELIDWLRDAYAMERGLEKALKKQAEADDIDPQLRRQINQHLGETRHHAELVKEALVDFGTDSSALKTGLAKTMETLKGVGTFFAEDDEVKDVLSAYAMEHFEIACYTSLKAGAEAGGFPKLASICDQIIEDEVRMADWLQNYIPAVTREFLAEKKASESAVD